MASWDGDFNFWFVKVNKGITLFDSKEFDDQFKANCATLNQDTNTYVNACYQLYNDLQNNNSKSLSIIEKPFLVGAVFDRIWSYENRGGSAITSDRKSKLRKRTWLSIKKQYDLACANAISRFPSRFSVDDFVDRTDEDLRIQYKLMVINSICHFESIRSLLLEWCCDLNKDGALISKSESLISKPDDRYDDALAEIDSLLKSVTLGCTYVSKDKEPEIGLTTSHVPKRISKPNSAHLVDSLISDDIINRFMIQINPPSSLTYYHPNDYYNQIYKMTRLNYKSLKPWTDLENTLVRLLAGDMYYAAGTKVISRGSTTSPFATYLIYEDCWKRIKFIFDRACEKYECMTGDKEAHPYERSWEQLAQHFQVLTNINWCTENRFFHHDLVRQWYIKYNKDNVLFDPREFLDQFRKNQLLLQQEEKTDASGTVFLPSNAALANISNLSENEEVILFGAVEDRDFAYMNRGGSGITSNANTDLGRRTWLGIKKQYDLAWRNAIHKFPARFNSNEYVERSPEELRVQYKMIFMRPMRTRKENGTKKYIIELKNIWNSDFNKNGELISRSESLASQPDERYYKYDVPNPESVEGSPESTGLFESTLSAWNDFGKRKSIQLYENTFSSINVVEAVERNKANQASGFNPSKVNLMHNKRTGWEMNGCSSQSSSKRKRENDWIKDEEVILYGVMLARLHQVKQFSNESHHPSVTAGESIKRAFDIARARYLYRQNSIPTNSLVHSDRSIETLEQRFKTLQEQAQRDSAYEHYLRDMWINVYNKDSLLLDADCFKYVHASGTSNNKHSDYNVVLFGVLIQLFLANGAIYEFSGSKKWTEAHDDCWKWVKCVFDRVWLKYCKSSTENGRSSSTADTDNPTITEKNFEELSQYYALHILGKLEEYPFLLHELHEEWIGTYNKDSQLLCADDFDTYAKAENLSNRINIHTLKEAGEAFRDDPPKRSKSVMYPYTIEEEIILVGVVLDYFLSRGLLSSARKNGNGGNDCWDKIKLQFDLVCSNAINKTGIQIPSYKGRTPKGLYGHYKSLRGSKIENKTVSKTRFGSLVNIYDRWQLLNKNGTLLPKSDYLCNKNGTLPTR